MSEFVAYIDLIQKKKKKKLPIFQSIPSVCIMLKPQSDNCSPLLLPSSKSSTKPLK